jgi:peptidoglycan DL-endopeptidase CwlO
MVPWAGRRGEWRVQRRDSARRVVLTMGTGLVLLATATAVNVPAALAAPQARSGSFLVRAGGHSGQAGLIGPGALVPGPVVPGPVVPGPVVPGPVVPGPVVPGPVVPGPVVPGPVVPVADLSRPLSAPGLAPLRGLLQADLLVVAPTTLRGSIAAAVRRIRGVVAAQQVDAARIQVNGKFIAMLGVDPSAFRGFAAKPTAQSAGLWQNVADGGVAVSYEMGKLDNLPLGGLVRVVGQRVEQLPVAGFGTVGIPGIDAVVSDTVARSLGMPAGNAIVISAPRAELNPLMKRIQKLLPRGAAIAPLVAQTATSAAAPAAGAAGVPAAAVAPGAVSAYGPGLTRAQIIGFLTAAVSRLGLPYVWGGDGPDVFDCSGLVQWSFAQAGVVMPRVAADQARTGPVVPVSQVQPGDLLFYHTDPTAPGYISHVAIYLGHGEMVQAPEPGLDVEIVPASFGSEFAGAIQVYPRVAAAVAADAAG